MAILFCWNLKILKMFSFWFWLQIKAKQKVISKGKTKTLHCDNVQSEVARFLKLPPILGTNTLVKMTRFQETKEHFDLWWHFTFWEKTVPLKFFLPVWLKGLAIYYFKYNSYFLAYNMPSNKISPSKGRMKKKRLSLWKY